MSMSLRYTNIQTLSRLPKMSFMKHWNVVGVLVSPKGIMRHSKEPYKGAIVSLESRLPFVTLLDSDQMVGMLEVDYRIEFGLAWAVEEVSNAR